MNGYSMILVLTAILCYLAIARGNNISDPYKDLIVGLAETHIYSPGYEEGRDYWENMTRNYRLTTNYVNHTLVLTMHHFVLESEDKNHDCLYDNLTIYDGYNESYPKLTTICGNKTGTHLQTTGNVVYLVLITDHDNNYRGFDIGVKSDGPTTTTSTTTTSTTSNTTPSPTTASTTVKTTSSSSTTLTSITTTSVSKSDTDDKSKIFIIVGAAVGGLLLLILLLVLIICLVKKKRPKSAVSTESTTKRVLWSRGNTKVQPIDFAKTDVPPGEIVQTNIFDMDLPTGQGKANLLPPLSVRLPE